MRNETRIQFNAYAAHLAQLNGVTDATTKFTVSPTVEQKLEDRIQASSAFLGEINIVPVNDQSGQTLGLGATSPVAGRTDTTLADRQTRSITGLTPKDYECKKTDFDSHITYQQLDAWAKFPDFQTRCRDHVTKQIGRDRLMIGWHGTSAAATTDIATNPMLQDVNIGWLQHLRTQAPERVLADVKVGAGGDYLSYDAAVFDAISSLIDDWHQEDQDIVVLIGRALLSDKYLALINSADAPTENAAMQTLLLNRTIGGRKAKAVPFFPGKSILITSPKNLSIYWQSGSHRRKVEDNSKRDRIEDYNSVNEAYVIEDLGAAALLENILVPDGAGGWV